ncbi:MAG: DUF4221 family protein [Bacteroides sp.]|uniref:DUF4221 family protein n=1 Tax=Bacteroides sp. TaxID=29523 RepID=UPI002FC6C4E4
MKGFLLFVFFLPLFGCQDNLKTATNYNDASVVKLQTDSICIPLDSVSLSSYPSATFIYSTKENTAMYAFNTKTWAIDVFDFNRKALSYHIELEREGANGVPYIDNMQVLSSDSIVCFADNGFLILNSNGEVLKRETMNYSGSDYIANFDVGAFAQPFYNRSQNRIYGRLITSKEPYPYPEGQQLFAEYNIENQTWRLLPIYLPSYMQENWQRMGQNRNLNMWISDDRICYNFTCLSDIFVYDILKQNGRVAGGESRLIHSNVSPYNGNPQNEKARWEHWIENPVFYTPIYDKYKDLYYRIQVGELKEQLSEAPTPYDKKIVLAVFNSKLEIIAEHQLDNYKYNFLFFGVDKEGLIVGGNNPKDTTVDFETLKLYRLRVS